MLESSLEPLLSERDLARVMCMSLVYVRILRRTGNGPAAIRVGRVYRYAPSDVRAWLAARKIAV